MKSALSKIQIEKSLYSAVKALTPDISGNIDLSAPQSEEGGQSLPPARKPGSGRWMVVVAAACLCLCMLGGVWYDQRQNQQEASRIGIDGAPSLELSVNRRERVLAAQALNADGDAILQELNLEGEELDAAVAAIVNSMTAQGYLDTPDNAILLTVGNDSADKAEALCADLVQDIENALTENETEAVIYDQQATEDETARALAQKYGISYGKAYFLRGLTEANPEFSLEDAECFSGMTMEEISEQILKNSLALGKGTGTTAELAAAAAKEAVSSERTDQTENGEIKETAETEENEPSGENEETSAAAAEESETEPESAQETESETEPENDVNPVPEEQTEIDFVDYEDGKILVYFLNRVHWENPSAVVYDEKGISHTAVVTETSGDTCIIEAPELESGADYTFVLRGVILSKKEEAVAVKGYFETPQIADGAQNAHVDEEP